MRKKIILFISLIIVLVFVFYIFIRFTDIKPGASLFESENLTGVGEEEVSPFSFYRPMADLSTHTSENFPSNPNLLERGETLQVQRSDLNTDFNRMVEFMPYGTQNRLVPEDFFLGNLEDLFTKDEFYIEIIETIISFSEGFFQGSIPQSTLQYQWKESVYRVLDPYQDKIEDMNEVRLGRIIDTGDEAQADIVYLGPDLRISGEIYLNKKESVWLIDGILLKEEPRSYETSFEPFAYSSFLGF